MTLYLRDAPTQAVARRIIEVYRAHCPTDRLRFVTGGDAPAFTPLTEAFGQTLAERVTSQSWQAVGRHADIARLSQGVVVRAGDHPVLGDRNRNAWPTEVAAVEVAFAGIKLRQHGATLAWLQRYLDREAVHPPIAMTVQCSRPGATTQRASCVGWANLLA